MTVKERITPAVGIPRLALAPVLGISSQAIYAAQRQGI